MAVLLAAGLLVVGCSGGTSTSTTLADRPVSNDVTTTTAVGSAVEPNSATDTTETSGSSSEEIREFLSSPSVFVDLVVDGSVSATENIGAAGGTVTLNLGDEVSATLDIPSGALEAETPITLLKVNALADSGVAVAGVELSPSGLMFPLSATPVLTISGGSPGQAAWLVDSDGVAERPSAFIQPDGSVRIRVPHFSAAGVAPEGAAPQLPPTPGTALYGTLQGLLDELAQRMERGEPHADLDHEIDRTIDRIKKEWVDPLLDDAASHCGGARRAIGEVLRYVSLGYEGIGTEHNLDLSKIDKALSYEADCARTDCKNGIDTAAGNFQWVIRSRQLLLDDGSDQAMFEELRTTFQGCMLLRLGLRMHGDLRFSGAVSFAFREDARADGIVRKNAEKTPTVLPLRITSSGTDRLAAFVQSMIVKGFAAAAGYDVSLDTVKCSLQYSGAGALSVAVSTMPNPDPKGYPVPSVALTPYSPKGTVHCGTGTDVEYLPDLGISVQALQSGLVISAESFKHDFDATSGASSGRWFYTQTTPYPPIGEGWSGNITVELSVGIVTERRAAESPSIGTDDLVNMAAHTAQMMAGG